MTCFLPFDTETERATETSIVGIDTFSRRDVVRGGGKRAVSLAEGDTTGREETNGDRIGEDLAVPIEPVVLFESERSSRVLTVSSFGLLEGALRLMISQFGSFMPA